jgi:hypothetical protein
MSYWEDCISEAADECGLVMTNKQLMFMVSAVEGSHKNYGLATGRDCIPDPRDTEIKELKQKYEKELEYKEKGFEANIRKWEDHSHTLKRRIYSLEDAYDVLKKDLMNAK